MYGICRASRRLPDSHRVSASGGTDMPAAAGARAVPACSRSAFSVAPTRSGPGVRAGSRARTLLTVVGSGRAVLGAVTAA